MDWLNWTIRAFTVIGGTFAFVCFLLGAFTLWGLWRNACELYKAKKKFHAYQQQSREFKIWQNAQEEKEDK